MARVKWEKYFSESNAWRPVARAEVIANTSIEMGSVEARDVIAGIEQDKGTQSGDKMLVDCTATGGGLYRTKGTCSQWN